MNPIQNLKQLNGNISLNNNSENIMDNLLTKETINHQTEVWNKLNKTTKITKLQEFAEVYSENNNIDFQELFLFLSSCIDRKKLLKNSDVNYDINEQKIINIPNLLYVSKTKKYTLKRPEKRQSTLKSLSNKKKLIISESEDV